MKNLANIQEEFTNGLRDDYPENEVQVMFKFLIEKFLDIPDSRMEFKDIYLKDSPAEKFESALQRLSQDEPIQYILGEVCFFGRPFKVNSSVHVPRPETETLVNWVLEDFNELQKFSETPLSLLDIGTGCGILPITLNKELALNTTAVDLSNEALEVAMENAEINNAQVEFLKEDILKWNELPGSFSIIVCNPPYVLKKSKKDVQRKILKYEPPVALYVKDEDPMLFNCKIAELAHNSLPPKGLVYIEINKYHVEQTMEVFAHNGFKTQVRKDVFGNERTLKAYR